MSKTLGIVTTVTLTGMSALSTTGRAALGIVTTVTLTGMSALSTTGRAALGRTQPQRLSPFNQEEVMHKLLMGKIDKYLKNV
jgi:hypothetical protein